jgi:hypothetical protein
LCQSKRWHHAHPHNSHTLTSASGAPSRRTRLKAGPPPIPDLYLDAEIDDSQQGFASSRNGNSLAFLFSKAAGVGVSMSRIDDRRGDDIARSNLWA